jgi:hypothetical protein
MSRVTFDTKASDIWTRSFAYDLDHPLVGLAWSELYSLEKLVINQKADRLGQIRYRHPNLWQEQLRHCQQSVYICVNNTHTLRRRDRFGAKGFVGARLGACGWWRFGGCRGWIEDAASSAAGTSGAMSAPGAKPEGTDIDVDVAARNSSSESEP